MEISVTAQAATLAGAVMMGFGVGILYDLLRLLRGRLRLPLLGSVLDLLFWIIVTGALFYFVIAAAGGEVRIYVLLALFGGAMAYFLTLSVWILSLGNLLADSLVELFRFIFLPIRLGKQAAKKIQKYFKNLFLYRRKWYKIKATFEGMEEAAHLGAARREEGGCHASSKSRTADQSADSRTPDCSGYLSAGSQQPDGTGSGAEG